MSKHNYRELKGTDLVSDSFKQINDNTNALLSGFEGSEFPENPIKGQCCFKDDVWYTYNGEEWKPDNTLHNHDNSYYTKSWIEATLSRIEEILNNKLEATNKATTSAEGVVFLATDTNDSRPSAVPNMAMLKSSLSSVAPIGMVYLQFAGMLAPTQLFGGTWNNISSTFAGRFFRAEGGAAAAFGSSQGDATRDFAIAAPAGSISFFPFRPSGNYNPGSPITIAGASASSVAARGVPTAGEIRPINSTIRIWRRVA